MKLIKVDDSILYFVHIPKCAGTTFTDILVNFFGEGNTLYEGTDHWIRFLKFINYEIKYLDLKHIRSVSGHFVFGLHLRIEGTPIYVSLVRNPIERCMSSIKFIQSDKDHYLHSQLFGMDVNSAFEALVALGEFRLIGRQCEFICGADSFELARHTIANEYFLVAPIARFDDFVKILSLLFFRKQINYLHKNKTQYVTQDSFSPSVCEAIHEIARDDFKLLNYVEQQFEDNWGYFCSNFK